MLEEREWIRVHRPQSRRDPGKPVSCSAPRAPSSTIFGLKNLDDLPSLVRR
jgi:hypothetical protein